MSVEAPASSGHNQSAFSLQQRLRLILVLASATSALLLIASAAVFGQTSPIFPEAVSVEAVAALIAGALVLLALALYGVFVATHAHHLRERLPLIEADRQAHRKVAESEALLEQIVTTCPALVYVINLETREVEFISSRMPAVLGPDPGSIRPLGGKLLRDFVHPNDRDTVSRHLRRLKSLPDKAVAWCECKLAHRNGEYRSFNMRNTVFARSESGQVVKVIGVAVDITELRTAERSLDLAQKAISDLSNRLLKLQEEERQRIAVELHDSTSQHLAAAGLNLMSLRRELNGSGDSKLFDDIERSLDEAHKEIRIISYLLAPPNLEREGLKTTLARYVEGFSRRTGLEAQISISDAVDSVSIDLQRALLRIIQEALSNVHRHAGATEVKVSLQRKPRHLSIRVEDNGRGMPGADNRKKEEGPALGVGVPGMRARVDQFGGRLRIWSGARGTKICARIPLLELPEKIIWKVSPSRRAGQVIPVGRGVEQSSRLGFGR
jgi:PAS domain S-box-containing protein